MTIDNLLATVATITSLKSMHRLLQRCTFDIGEACDNFCEGDLRTSILNFISLVPEDLKQVLALHRTIVDSITLPVPQPAKDGRSND